MRKNSKENTSHLFNRYIWLIDTIYQFRKITFEEINKRWNRSQMNTGNEDIPLRTFHNHRKAIEEIFDINIECDKRNNYKYYIENIEDMERDGARSWLLNTLAVNNLINESHKLKHRILFEQIPSGQEHLTSIIKAMHDSLTIEITYQSYWKDTPATFVVEPYCVKVFKRRWYMIARSPRYGKEMIYALDRINNLNITETPFKFPADFDPQGFFYHSYGIIVDKEDYDIEQIKIKVYEKKRRYFYDLPLHHSQQKNRRNRYIHNLSISSLSHIRFLSGNIVTWK